MLSGLYERVFGNPNTVKTVLHFGHGSDVDHVKIEGTRAAIDALRANLKCHAAEAPEGYEVEFAEPRDTCFEHSRAQRAADAYRKKPSEGRLMCIQSHRTPQRSA